MDDAHALTRNSFPKSPLPTMASIDGGDMGVGEDKGAGDGGGAR
jgi:hypothetical protein